MNMHTKPKAVTPPLPERIRIVENYRASGLKISEFARQHDLAVATLGYWNKQYTKVWRHMDGHIPREFALANGLPVDDNYMAKKERKLRTIDAEFTRTPKPDEPDWKRMYEDERHKVEALQKVIAVLGFQL